MEPLGPRADALWIQLPGSFGPGDVPRPRPVPAHAARHPQVRRRGSPPPPSSPRPVRSASWRRRCTGPARSGSRSTPRRSSDAAADQRRGAGGVDAQAAPAAAYRVLTDRPIVRYLGRDDPPRTVEGWQPWLDVVTGWLREGRSPTVFVHTPTTPTRPSWPPLPRSGPRARARARAAARAGAGRSGHAVLTQCGFHRV
ncbi:hypothetical protein [Micromonospora sp. b486]|uniref:hypothetical protein n=1 Tax=Micromonospora sp. b486 TaxID=3053986 RepID=UPI00259C9FF0|nr:hypothetical protein [Micromonospora sp. b486]MDM4778104.1 hypothetical protein [Micromonospora sp. b486]